MGEGEKRSEEGKVEEVKEMFHGDQRKRLGEKS